MSSATDNNEKIDSSTAFAVLEEAIAVLEEGVARLAGSIAKERGGDFNLVQAVWEGQKLLSEACRNAPLTGGDDLWPRVTVIKFAAEETLAHSKKFAALAKRRRELRKEIEAERNGHRADGPVPYLPSCQPGGNGHGDPDRARREAARRARQLARSGPKGGAVAAKSGDGKGKNGGRR